MTLKELAEYLETKEEHYPLSDDFIKHHQQKKGGYIRFAIEKGYPVDKSICEPNQKWHFFESWLLPNIKGGFSWEDDAEKRVYNLKCPELLLWFWEAVGIEKSKVETAKKIAEDGKETAKRMKKEGKDLRGFIPQLAKDIIATIPWEDVEKSIEKEKK